MAGVRHLHISEGQGDSFSAGLHRLHCVLQGVKCAEGMYGRGDQAGEKTYYS